VATGWHEYYCLTKMVKETAKMVEGRGYHRHHHGFQILQKGRRKVNSNMMMVSSAAKKKKSEYDDDGFRETHHLDLSQQGSKK